MLKLNYLPKRSAFPNELKLLFEQLAALAVASSFGAVALGCESSERVEESTVKPAITPLPARPSPAQWQAPPECVEGGFQLAGLKLAKPVDYIAAIRSGRMLDQAASFRFISAKHGTPCATATDKKACEAEVAKRMTPPEECGCEPSLLVTEGDTVRSLARAEEYLELAGPIDTSAEALLAAFLAGQHVTCNDGTHEGTKLRESGTGYEVFTKWEQCSLGVFEQSTLVAANGSAQVGKANKLDESHCVIGRRPEGLCFVAPLVARTALGEYFACAARLEAASVFAFERLGRELRALGAPQELAQRCTQSALEEIEHTKLMSALARCFDAEPALPVLAPLPLRAAVEIAIENAIEGCVRETFGALIGYHQAATAREPNVREAMIAIVRDEVQHAELAWAISRWLEPRLSPAEQAQVALARAFATQELEAGVDLELGDAERAAIGWPSREVQGALLSRLRLAIGAALRRGM